MKKKKKQKKKTSKKVVSGSHLQELISKSLSLAVKAHQSGNISQAEVLYRKILQVDPENANSLHLLGLIAHQTRNNQESIDLISRAIANSPRIANFHFNLAVVLQEENRLRDACKAYEKAIELHPVYPEAYENLGVALHDLGDYSQAMDAYRAALKHNPNSLIALRNYGTILRYTGQEDSAFTYFRKAVEIAPGDPTAHMKYAMALLNRKEFVKGWMEYEWRWHDPEFLANNPPKIVPFPKWDGTDISEKGIMIYPEQGIGDEVMFASCFPDILGRTKRCVIACDGRLMDIFARSFPSAQFIDASLIEQPERWELSQPIQYCLPAGSLPRFFRQSLDTFLHGNAYLKADINLLNEWKARLDMLGPSLKVGISWKGGRDPRARRARSMELSNLHSILSVRGAHFINLQYGDCHGEIEEYNRKSENPVIAYPEIDPISELEHFAALISVLDLVISIDNSTIHFSGALGTPTWALLPCPADWRWFRDADQSPWYSSLKLFRQSKPGAEAWSPLLKNVAGRLEKVTQSYTNKDIASARNSSQAFGFGSMSSWKNNKERIQKHFSKQSSPTVAFLNDTSSWYHWGCSCTSIAIHQQLSKLGFSIRSFPINKIRALSQIPSTTSALDDENLLNDFSIAHPELMGMLASADLVLLNGEGTLHGLGHAPALLLYLAYTSKIRYGKPVHIINHSCFPEDSPKSSRSSISEFYRKVYQQINFVAVREEISANLLSRLGIDVIQSFDCLPLYLDQFFVKPKQKDNYVVISGSAIWNQTHVTAFSDLVRDLCKKGTEVKFLLGADSYLASDDSILLNTLRASVGDSFNIVNSVSENQWLETIAKARLLISGRFHHTIAAAFLETPFLVMESNTPKIDGLLKMLELDGLIANNDLTLTGYLRDRCEDLLASPNKNLISESKKSQLMELAHANFDGLKDIS